MRTIVSAFLLLIFVSVCTHTASAQRNDPTFEELHRQMMEMQRQMMEELRQSPFNNLGFATPKGDSTFFFRFDTTFDGGSISQFFHFSPLHSDSTMRGNFFGFDDMFDQFFHQQRPPSDQPDYGIGDFPKDDGAENKSEDDLLPEERLRQQENGKEQPAPKQARPKSAEPRPDPKVKTIRI